MPAAIRIEHLSKAYRLGQFTSRTLWTDARRWLKRGGQAGVSSDGQPVDAPGMIWSLRDINLEIEQGSAIGVIGKNGAGKSTLLKILSRITSPTLGTIKIRGTCASLLEVGTGFHPELTGRENVFLNGAILGMRRAEIARRFDEIVDFSGVEQFIDTPVKRYSSGMYVRLAFAVAAHLDSDILLVDEVLAVGDAEFQKKCLGRLNSEARGNRTILFVSHNHLAVRQVCDTAVLLEHGRLTEFGPTARVLDKYLGSGQQTTSFEAVFGESSGYAMDGFRLDSVRIVDEHRRPIDAYWISRPHMVEIAYTVTQPMKVRLSLLVTGAEGENVFSSLNNHEPNFYDRVHEVGSYKSSVTIPGDLLNARQYLLSVGTWMPHADNFRAEGILGFEAMDDGVLASDYHGSFGGHVRPRLPWLTVVAEPTSEGRTPEALHGR